MTVSQTPALASLAADTVLRVHPVDLERIGVESGTEVEVHSDRGALRLPIVADVGIARGNVVVLFPSPSNRCGGIDRRDGTGHDVRIETRGGEAPR